MPTLNYENAGALVEYDYLQGTVTALYPEDDTADVSGVCGSLSKIPIFYHCKPDSVARDNGALTGAAGGFKVGDSVVVLKSSGGASSSLYSLDKIALKGTGSTATGPKYFVVGHYDGVRKCGGDILFFIVRREDSAYFIERYKIESLESGVNPAVLEGVVTLKPEIVIPETKQLYVVSGDSNINSLIVQCYAEYINGIRWPGWTGAGIDDWWRTANLRIPIEYFNETEYEIFEMGQYTGNAAKSSGLSPGGSRIGLSYGAANSDVDLYTSGIMRTTGTDLYVIEGLYYEGAYHPTQYIEERIDINCCAPCICDERLLAGVSCNVGPAYPDFEFPYDTEFLGYYIAEWANPKIGPNQWYYGTTPFLSVMTRKFAVLTQQEFNSLHQIVYHDGKAFVFFNFDQGEYIKGVWVNVYDIDTAELLSRVDYVEGWHFTRVSKVVYQSATYLCFATVDTWDTGDCSNLYLVNPETMASQYQVSLPFDYYDENLVVTNKPTTDRMTDHHNRIRHEWSAIYGTTWETKLYYLGRSEVCSAIAQEHLTWLLQTGRQQHEDANGDPVGVRALRHGILSAGENLASRWPTVSVIDDVDYVCDDETGWPSSPGHYANMVNREYSQMGWASGCYPASISSLICGPGAYVNGTYTTSETVVSIPTPYQGKVRLFVVVFAGG